MFFLLSMPSAVANAQPCTTDSLGNLRCPTAPAPFAGDLATMGDDPAARFLNLAPGAQILPAPPAAIPQAPGAAPPPAAHAAPRPLPEPGLRRLVRDRVCHRDRLGNVHCR